MDFLYGVLTTLGIIAFIAYGGISILGNRMNPASFIVGVFMDKRYRWIAILVLGLGALLIYYFKYIN